MGGAGDRHTPTRTSKLLKISFMEFAACVYSCNIVHITQNAEAGGPLESKCLKQSSATQLGCPDNSNAFLSPNNKKNLLVLCLLFAIQTQATGLKKTQTCHIPREKCDFQ